MTDSALPAMGVMFDEVCVLVTAAFALTLLPGFTQPERSLLSRRDQGTALVVFFDPRPGRRNDYFARRVV